MKFSRSVALLIAAAGHACAFAPEFRSSTAMTPLMSSTDSWQGDIVPNQGGIIKGCFITPVGESVTEWEINIDGEEADLGKFSEAIYKKLMMDAKQQRFQGFRPGTIPPHLEPTYRAFAMDECARETVLEAMEQNSIRPFTDARTDLIIENVSIPPPAKKKGRTTKKKSGRKARAAAEAAEAAEAAAAAEAEAAGDSAAEEPPKWLVFENMKGAIDAGWKPGQSFSFQARNVKGQKVLADDQVKGSTPLGLNY